jgi:hypothetical protein
MDALMGDPAADDGVCAGLGRGGDHWDCLNPLASAVSEEQAAPVMSKEPAAPAMSVEQAAPAMSVEQAAPAMSVEPAAPAMSVEQAAPTMSVDPAASVKSVVPTAPAKSVDPAAPAKSVDPAAPAMRGGHIAVRLLLLLKYYQFKGGRICCRCAGRLGRGDVSQTDVLCEL